MRRVVLLPLAWATLVACLLVTVPITGQPAAFAPAVPDAVRIIPLSDVRLTGGPLKAAQDADARYLLSLDPDRMLAWPRRRAGLPSRAEPYGGWDGDGKNLTGHIAGHYLSGVSLMYAATGDVRFKARADHLVSELKAVQEAAGDGYIGAVARLREAFAEVGRGDIRSASFDLNGLWSPWYTLHKTYAGLRDAYRLTGNRDALTIERRFAEWAERVLAPLDEAQMQRVLHTEFGGMNEVLADLYADTGDPRWLRLSHRFDHHAVMDPLSRGEDVLDGLHGNTQVPKVLGAAVRYGYEGLAADRDSARTFWDRVVNHHTFATGGHGKDEYFRDADRLAPIVDGRTAETCNVYNMLKLTRRLFAHDPREAYAAFMERALFNHILGSIEPQEGAMCYMVPVGRAVGREYQDMQRSFTCCVGSGMESHALHGEGLYAEAGDRFWVNLYAPSTARWARTGLRFTMDTDLPEGTWARLTVEAPVPKAFALLLRRPAWATEGFGVRVNGTAVPTLPSPGSYVEIARTWTSGDAVEIALPKTLRLERLPDQPSRAAVLWGPLVLAGDLGPEPRRAPGQGDDVDLEAADVEAPVIVTPRDAPAAWLAPVPGEGGRFRLTARAAVLGAAEGRVAPAPEFTPFYRLHHRTYAAYWDILTPDAFAAASRARRDELAAARARDAALTSATVLVVPVGDADGERPFAPAGEGTSLTRQNGRAGRRGTKWFSYRVPIGAARPLSLVVTYDRDNRRARQFDIMVDGVRIASEAMPKDSTAAFVDRVYPVPATAIDGKAAVTLRFEGTAGSEISTVFGLRVVQGDVR